MELSRKQKLVLALALVIFCHDIALGQSGATGIAAGTNELRSYVTPVTNLTMAIGSVVGIVGGIRIYNKWNSGDQDVQKELMGWLASLIFLIVAPLVIRGFFGT